VTTEELRVLLGGARSMKTAAGILSLSPDQTGWTVQTVRHRLPDALRDLTDLDIVWLLTRGWEP
jgi:NaMN:DMB phosphoribosyltransferase